MSIDVVPSPDQPTENGVEDEVSVPCYSFHWNCSLCIVYVYFQTGGSYFKTVNLTVTINPRNVS